MEDNFESESDRSVKAVRRERRKQEKTERQAKRNPKPIEPRTAAQSEYIRSLKTNSLTFAVGPAGVGKTYVAARVYGEMLVAGTIKKIYIARPPVAKSKHRMGFLPGNAEEKTAPWLVPVFEGLKDAMSPSEFDRYRREKKIEEVPYEFMQGRTIKDAAWIVDEAENLDLDDFYITLTRQGEDLTMAICGDPRQTRINNSGMARVVKMVEEFRLKDTEVISFTKADVTRSKQAAQWVDAFDRMTLPDVPFCDKDEARNFADNPPSFLKKET